MREITHEEYLDFLKEKGKVVIGDNEIKLSGEKVISQTGPPHLYTLERTTVWSFPDRGGWATHKGDYRGNWSPYIPRNLILKYTEEGDTVLDQMMGGGTTLVEAKLLGRNAIGVDININAVMLARDRLNFRLKPDLLGPSGPEILPTIKTFLGDARNLDKIDDNTIDLIATHPPYANIISYSRKQDNVDDISRLPFPKYLEAMELIAREAFRVLKPGKVCAILIGDTRKHKHYVPISYYVMESFLRAGFILMEDIVKVQWNMKGTLQRWRKKEYDFYLIFHEHIFIFRKPESRKEYRKYKFSSFRDRGEW